MAAIAGVEPTTLRLKVIVSTKAIVTNHNVLILDSFAMRMCHCSNNRQFRAHRTNRTTIVSLLKDYDADDA